jgi:hypothetical protein
MSIYIAVSSEKNIDMIFYLVEKMILPVRVFLIVIIAVQLSKQFSLTYKRGNEYEQNNNCVYAGMYVICQSPCGRRNSAGRQMYKN